MRSLRNLIDFKKDDFIRWRIDLRLKSLRHGLAFNSNDRKLLSLRNRYKGRRVFIIGNGPSLRNTDVSLLKDEITIGCNGIFLMYDHMGFLPTFYTVEDRLVAEDRADIINRMTGTIKIFPLDLKYCLKPYKDTIYVNFLREYPGFPKLTDNFESHVYWGGTVTLLNIQLAYYLGVREVYLIGIDHNYHPPSQADEQRGTVITSHTDDVNHFHPDYFGLGYRYHDPRVDRMEAAYQKAREFFEAHGGIIYNATVGGNLEVFQRIDYDAIWR
jgi:hypothetical protein